MAKLADEKAEGWASQFTCPLHGVRAYATVLTTKCCGEVLPGGEFCNEVLRRGKPRNDEWPPVQARG